jgi:hypothetical protein
VRARATGLENIDPPPFAILRVDPSSTFSFAFFACCLRSTSSNGNAFAIDLQGGEVVSVLNRDVSSDEQVPKFGFQTVTRSRQYPCRR